MATFALVGCTPPPLQEAGPAYLMCRSESGFAQQWERATKEASVSLILSPEYGLVHPDEVLRSGDEGLGDERWGRDPDRWLDRVQREVAALRFLEEPHRWLLFADGPWADRVETLLQQSGHTVERI